MFYGKIGEILKKDFNLKKYVKCIQAVQRVLILYQGWNTLKCSRGICLAGTTSSWGPQIIQT